MNKWIASAGAFSTATIFLHIIGGGADVHVPILEGDLSVILKAYVSVLWHAVTVILVINSAALLVAAAQESTRRTIVWLVVGQYFGYAGLFIFYGLERLGTILLMPQWVFFLGISGLALMGLRSTSRPNDTKVE